MEYSNFVILRKADWLGPQKGPKGGTFWVNSETQEKFYGDQPPGGSRGSGEGQIGSEEHKSNAKASMVTGMTQMADAIEQEAGLGAPREQKQAKFLDKAKDKVKNTLTGLKRAYVSLGKLIHNMVFPNDRYPDRQPYPMSEEEKLIGQTAAIQTVWSFLPKLSYGALAAGALGGVTFPVSTIISAAIGSLVVYPAIQKALRNTVNKNKQYNDNIIRFLDFADTQLTPEEESQVFTRALNLLRKAAHEDTGIENQPHGPDPEDQMAKEIGPYMGHVAHDALGEITRTLRNPPDDLLEQIYNAALDANQSEQPQQPQAAREAV